MNFPQVNQRGNESLHEAVQCSKLEVLRHERQVMDASENARKTGRMRLEIDQFGLFGLSRLFRLFGASGLFGMSGSTKQTR